MITTIDAAGRIVVPKALRDAAHLRPGMPLEVRFCDGRIEIEPAPASITIEVHGAVAVAIPSGPMPVLTSETVANVLQQLRDEQG